MELLKEIACGSHVWILLLCVGIFFTLKLKFFQIRCFGKLIKPNSFKKSGGEVSPLQSFFVALGGSLGIGNIAGVATAMSIGGAGTIFWMWVSGFFGMMTKYAETLLAVHYKNKKGNRTFGGPMYYIEYGVGSKALAIIFALFGCLASFGVGNIAQTNSVASAVEQSFSVPPLISGIFLCVICGAVILGGAKKLAKVMEKLVPYMTIFYLCGCLYIIFAHSENLAKAFTDIFVEAFSGNALLGASVGVVIKEGILKGLFSNEAGMGSTPIAYASVKNAEPVCQGMLGILEVFVDTIVVCTITALALLVTGCEGFAGMIGAISAFESILPNFGGYFITVSCLLFAVASTLSWCYYGGVCAEYLLGLKGVKIYNILFVIALIPGAMFEMSLAWDVADILNGMMMLPNLFALIILSKKVISLTKNSLYI